MGGEDPARHQFDDQCAETGDEYNNAGLDRVQRHNGRPTSGSSFLPHPLLHNIKKGICLDAFKKATRMHRKMPFFALLR